jgi:hypothetical protein
MGYNYDCTALQGAFGHHRHNRHKAVHTQESIRQRRVEIDATDSTPKNIRDDHGVDEARPQSGYGEDGPGQRAEKSITPNP